MLAAFYSSIQSVLIIVILIALGYVMRYYRWFGDDFGSTISKFLLNIALPVAIFTGVLSSITLKQLEGLYPAFIYSICSILICYIIAFIIIKLLRVRVGRRGSLINMLANSNALFIGLPINLALFGNDGTPYFLVYYVVCTFSLWTLGVIVMSWDNPMKNQNSTKHKIPWKHFLSMPLVSFVVAVIFLCFPINVMHIKEIHFFWQAMGYIAALVTPLALIYIGIVLCNAGITSIRFDKDMILALGGRLIIAPIVISILILFGSHLDGMAISFTDMQVLVVQAGIPGVAVLPILANENHGDVPFATNAVTGSTILFVITLPIIMMLTSYLGY